MAPFLVAFVSFLMPVVLAEEPAPPVASPEGAVVGDRGSVEAELRRLEKEVADLRRQLAELRGGAASGGTTAALEERLRSVEAALAALKEELARVAEESRAATDAVDTLSEAEQRSTHVLVYGDLVGIDLEDEDSVLDAEAVELVLSGQPHRRLSFFAEVEFERAAAVGGERGGEVVVEQAYANLRLHPAFNLRAGVVLLPFGAVNLDHYAPVRDVVEKPLVAYVVAPSDWTDNGLGVYGRAILRGEWLLEYETYVVAGLDGSIDAGGMRDARQPYGEDNNDDKAVVGRIALRGPGRLEIGASGYSGAYDDASRRRLEGWAVDARGALGPVFLSGEYDAFTADDLGGRDAHLSGFYARAVVTPLQPLLRRGAHGRTFPEAELAFVLQLDRVVLEAPDDTGTHAENRERRVTYGVNYRPSHEWVVKLNYEVNDADAAPLVHGNKDGWFLAIGFLF